MESSGAPLPRPSAPALARAACAPSRGAPLAGRRSRVDASRRFRLFHPLHRVEYSPPFAVAVVPRAVLSPSFSSPAMAAGAASARPLPPLLLRALGYPGGEAVDPSSFSELSTLVLWIENTVVRSLAIADRAGLASQDPAEWCAAWASYLRAVGCPHGGSAVTAVEGGGEDAASKCVPSSPAAVSGARPAAVWLLHHAVGSSFSDRAEAGGLAEVVSSAVAAAPEPQAWSLECLPALADVGDARVAEVVGAIEEALHVRNSEGAEEMTEAAEASEGGEGAAPPSSLSVLSSRLDRLTRVVETELGPAASSRHLLGLQALDQLPLGFSTGSANADACAKVLRALLADDQRALQDRIDTAVASVQEITADPRTDAKLYVRGKG